MQLAFMKKYASSMPQGSASQASVLKAVSASVGKKTNVNAKAKEEQMTAASSKVEQKVTSTPVDTINEEFTKNLAASQKRSTPTEAAKEQSSDTQTATDLASLDTSSSTVHGSSFQDLLFISTMVAAVLSCSSMHRRRTSLESEMGPVFHSSDVAFDSPSPADSQPASGYLLLTEP
jgi:hypothetical protein